MEEKIMKIKIKDDILKAVFNTLQNVIDEGIISLQKKKICICVLDENRASFIEFIINDKDFESLQKTIASFDIGVNFEVIWKIVKEFKEGEITIDFQEKKIIFQQKDNIVEYFDLIKCKADQIYHNIFAFINSVDCMMSNHRGSQGLESSIQL